MKRKELSKLLNPKTIAVIGASDHPKKVGYILMEKLSNFVGEVIPINKDHKELFGRRVYGSVLKYPKKIDLVVIAIPSKFVKEVLRECGEKKVRNVIVISAGFAEMGNKELEFELVKLARKYGINLLGPNCFGVANPYLNLDTTFANTSPKRGDVAFVSQSGALWSYLSDLSENGKIGFSNFVSLGNMADLNFSDFIEYFNKDKRTKKIVLYIERLKDGKRFIEACRKSKKKIFAIKAGKTESGSEATVSHTGSLATDFNIYQGAFRQAKIKLVDSLYSVFEHKKVEIKIPFDKEKKIMLITNAGGAGALVTDYLVEKGFIVEPMLDLLGTALAKDYEIALDNLKNKNYNFVVILTPQRMSDAEETAKAIVNFKKKSKKKILTFFLGDISVKAARKMLNENKIDCVTHI